jgi:hypothetical protein
VLPESTLVVKYNNFVAWLEIMKTDAGALYGSTARLFTSNERYVPRLPTEADYNPALPQVHLHIGVQNLNHIDEVNALHLKLQAIPISLFPFTVLEEYETWTI